ncbi:MAG: adenylyl-sulfate kinase [Deltaproteobacteria bacterium]|nr:adenylyl-sulfate kinase [Deltaproteobacteria bacterium]
MLLVTDVTPRDLEGGRRSDPARTLAPVDSRGFILWFTGLSGSGKTTLAAAVARTLGAAHRIEILDGDEVRTHLSKGLGFSRQDRDTNVHRIGYVARLLAGHGVGVIAAAISPYADARREVRALAEQRGITVVEVFANASLEALIARDVKGLYKQALAGELPHFTGISDPYEAPTAPDVEVRTDVETIDQSAAKIVAALRLRGLVAPTTHADA